VKVLILGGYGVFGGRLARLLADVPELELVVAGRSAAKARDFCTQYESAATMTPAVVDRREIEPALAALRPDVLVDASGPFQEYGESRYDVVRCCIRRRINYLDLADAPEFVRGVSRFDGAAKDAGVFVLSGISSFPALTSAVVHELRRRLTVRTLSVAIAPSPGAGVGKNVMRVVLGYSGSPIRLTRHGEPATGIGLVDNRRYTIAPPGHLPLYNRRFSLVDVPDLTLLPAEFAEIEDIWIGAGPVPEVLQRLLNLLALLRWRLGLPSLAPLAGLCHWAINAFRFGEHRGGMLVEAGDGRGKTIAWHLLAEGDDGAYIPSMAAESIVRGTLGGNPPRAGARAGTSALTLDDYREVFGSREIHMGIRHMGTRDVSAHRRSLFHGILGDRFDSLPTPVRQLHDGGAAQWRGRVTVTGARGLAGRLVARIFGFPIRDDETDARVEITPAGDDEIWVRTFGTKAFQSRLSRGEGRDAWLLCERFGAVSVSIALLLRDGKLWYVPRRWRLGPLPLPRALLPGGRSFETERHGAFAFDVTIEAPIVGLIAGYRGTLKRA